MSAKAKRANTTRPMSSREKVRRYRARMRTKGMRAITLWVPDVRSPKFAAEARRQCQQANASRHAQADQAWVESLSEWKI